jgi:uncharacterized protein
MLPITTLFTAILGVLFFVLSLRTINGRTKNKVSLGTGDSDDMLRRVRTHANFAEYIPLLLIILGLLEYRGVPDSMLYIFGTIVVVGRILHFYGLYSATTPLWARIYGMQCTLWPLLLGSLYLLYQVIL